MKKCILFPLLLMFTAMATQSFAANWYVAKGASGSNNGTNWTNAWNEWSQINFSAVSCGDSIWVAGGTAYTSSLSIKKLCTSSTPLVIRRVLSTDSVPTSAAGWNPSFDSQVVTNNGTVTMGGGAYYTIDGRVGDAASGVAYGMQWVYTSPTTAFGNTSSSIDDVTITYLEIYGPSCVTNDGNGGYGSGTCTGNTWGFNLNQGTNTNILIDHSWIHRWAEVVRPYQTTGLTIQYSYLGDSAWTPSDHNDCMYASDPFKNLTFRYNRVYSCSNEGLWFDNNGVVNAYIYDNIFYHSAGWVIGWPRCSSQSTCGPIYIFNNIFQSDGAWGEQTDGWIGTESSALNASSLIQNNVFYNVSPNGSTASLVPFESYNAATPASGSNPPSCTGCFSYAVGSPLNSPTLWISPCGSTCTGPEGVINADWHLTSAGTTLFQAKGANLSSQCSSIPALAAMCTADMDGNPRPASGAWTLGPYESASTQALAPPTNLNAVVQ
ncbi:MAG: hypothetical protein WCA19_22335 [Candidatus Acidiferrales bacterium]